MLAVIETHPVQYHAPVYRSLQQQFNVPVTAIYGSNFSVAGYMDQEFKARFAWDTDLLSGYSSIFLSEVAKSGAQTDAEVSADGLREALHQLHPRAVLLLGYSPRFHQHAFLAARRTRRPLLFRGETTDHARQRGAVKSFLRDQALRWFYRRCERVLYVGERSRTHLRRLGCPDGKLIFSPYCVDLAAFQTEERDRERLREPVRRELGIGEHEVAMLFSGKLSPRKVPDLILAAVKSLAESVRERIVLVFLGEGELKESLKSEAMRTPKIRAHFPGFQNQSQLSRFYHAADLLVLPSLHSETWGLVVNEALHHGVPAVVSEGVGCGPDLLLPGLTGEVCATGSRESLASALERGLKLTHREDVRAACRRRVGDYSVPKAAEGIARAYRSVVTETADAKRGA